MEILTTVTFGEHQGKTTITVQWAPLNPTPAERKTFDARRDSMRMGWTGTSEQLGASLARIDGQFRPGRPIMRQP